MGSLLVAAFLATNVLSLVYMLFIAVGMAARPGWRRRAWRFAVVPLLGLLLIFQYTVSIWYERPTCYDQSHGVHPTTTPHFVADYQITDTRHPISRSAAIIEQFAVQ